VEESLCRYMICLDPGLVSYKWMRDLTDLNGHHVVVKGKALFWTGQHNSLSVVMHDLLDSSGVLIHYYYIYYLPFGFCLLYCF
jgi:hypothetical protein